MMFRTTPKKKARRAGRRFTKRAEKDAAKLAAVTQERAAEWAEKAGAASHEFADDVAGKLRHSDALAKAQVTGTMLAMRARDRWHDSDLDDRVTEFAERVRTSEAARRASGRTRAMTEGTLSALGDWLTKSKSGKEIGKRLGVRPKRRWPVVLAAASGIAGGYAVARSMGAGPHEAPIGDVLADSAERLGTLAEPTGTVVADSIRAALANDPRTVSLAELHINVAEGTVFVRGNVPPEFDQDAVRQVIRSVPGVQDVDLQLASA
jgi:hypothetical protein